MPYYQDEWLSVYSGDCRAVMAELPAESVHCVVTSPPYWGLRDYGTATWDGGDEGCDHGPLAPGRATRPAGGLEGGKATVDAGTVRGGDCGRCGARRQDSQLGLEPTPEEYVANLVDVFREVRRVLRADGTVWLNLGDSYSGPPKGSDNGWEHSTLTKPKDRDRTAQVATRGMIRERRDFGGLKPKDLVGIPWRVAFALQADGWYLRSDIIWSKPNPMPESVTDRPTKSHEYLFLLSKSPKYFWDADAVREEGAGEFLSTGVRNPRAAYADGRLPHEARGDVHKAPSKAVRGISPTGFQNPPNPAGRNIRSVWTIATQPYPGAHFATFPRKLVEPCIKAGTSERGVCPECGAPVLASGERLPWRPSCEHGGWFPDDGSIAHGFIYLPAPIPATILDPFAGSGTTGLVAQSLSRRAILIDLNADYLIQAMGRNRDIPLGLVS